MVRVRALRRAAIPRSLLPLPSPACSHSHRLATQITDGGKCCKVYLGSGAHLYSLKVELTDHEVTQGKDSLLIPKDAEVMDATQLVHCPHRAEIQSVSLSDSDECTADGVVLGSVDSYGRLMVCSDTTGEGAALYTAVPRDAGIGEGSWAGMAFTPNQPSLVVVARGLAKSIDLYDKDMHVRTLRTLHSPSAITFLDGPCVGTYNSSTIATTEGSQVSIWDLRAGERNGFVQRVLGAFSGGTLYALSSSSSGMVAAGGMERTVVVFDPHKWTAVSRWTGCLKYEISGLSFSSVDPDLLYVHGLDYEVVCGQWGQPLENSTRRQFAFRGDSRWLGFDKCKGSDVLAGWTESGSIFVGKVNI